MLTKVAGAQARGERETAEPGWSLGTLLLVPQKPKP